MNQYKIGIIGYGGFGRFLHTHWSNMRNVDIIAICDKRMDLKISGPELCHSTEELWTKDIDIVSIATPPSTHFDIAMEAIRSGVHVLVEKPVALTPEDVRALLAEAKKFNVHVSTNYMLRFNPLVVLVKQICGDRLLGDLIYASVVNVAQDESLPSEHWFWDQSISGGIFIEHAVHFFDMVYFVSGQHASRVNGFSSWRNQTQEDRVLGTVEHSGGLLATHFHAFIRPGFLEGTSVRFVFEYGEIELSGWIPLVAKFNGLMSDNLRNVFEEFDHVVTHTAEPGSIKDDSRPEGWGVSDNMHTSRHDLSQFQSVTQLEVRLNDSKSDVYGNCVKKSLLDFISRIEGADYYCIDDKSLLEAVSIASRAVSHTRTLS